MKPLKNKIQLDIQEQKIGAIQSDAIEEHGKIIAVGKSVSGIFEVGQTIYFKAWAVDIITKGNDKYYFVDSESDAICAIE